METDGELSVLPKSDKLPVTPCDINIQTISTGVMKDVVIDGNIITKNLKEANLDTIWLKTELNKQGLQKISEVFYAGIDSTNKLFISKKNDNYFKNKIN